MAQVIDFASFQQSQGCDPLPPRLAGPPYANVDVEDLYQEVIQFGDRLLKFLDIELKLATSDSAEVSEGNFERWIGTREAVEYLTEVYISAADRWRNSLMEQVPGLRVTG